jgi:protein TonB
MTLHRASLSARTDTGSPLFANSTRGPYEPPAIFPREFVGSRPPLRTAARLRAVAAGVLICVLVIAWFVLREDTPGASQTTRASLSRAVHRAQAAPTATEANRREGSLASGATRALASPRRERVASGAFAEQIDSPVEPSSETTMAADSSASDVTLEPLPDTLLPMPQRANELAPLAPIALPAPTVAASAASLEPIARETPEFPREALKQGIAYGEVRARISVDASGNIVSVDIVRAAPHRVFDRAVRDALAHWRFEPGAADRVTEIDFTFDRR